MPVEIQMLAWSIVLGLLQLLLAAGLVTRQRGLKWNAGPRDGAPPPARGVAGRMQRAFGNFLETFPLFAAAVLAVVATGADDAGTAFAAQLYFWARVAYVPLYASGIPFLRSLAWAAALWGIVRIVWALL